MNQQLHALVENRITNLLEVAKSKFGIIMDKPTIVYNLKGTKAGTASIQNVIRLNPVLLEQNVDEFIQRTVAHELAHILSYKLYGTLAHDKYWKRVMVSFGVEPSRCHSYDVSNVQRAKHIKTFIYKCKCKEHIITSIRHNKIVKNGTKYSCCHCHTVIMPV
jgi:SprT protein